jgi:hypothetical protein
VFAAEFVQRLHLAKMIFILGKTFSALANNPNRTRHDIRLKTGSRVSRATGVPASTCAGRPGPNEINGTALRLSEW